MLRTLLRHIGKYRTAALLTPMYTALECMVSVLIPYVTAWIIDDGIMVGNLHAVVQYGALMTVLAFASLAFGIGSGFCSAKASTGFARNLRSAMFRNIQTFSFANIDKFSTSGLITRLTTDVSNLQHAMQMVLRISVRAPLNLLFSIVMCVLISPSMSLIFVVATLLLGGGLYLIMSRAVRLFQQVFERYDDLNRIVRENISAIRVVKAFVREHHEAEKFDRAAVGMYALFTQTERLMALNHPMMNMVIYGCIIALSWFGAQQVVGGSLTTGQLTSLFSYVMMILNSLMMLSMIFV
ncbi:MAG: ABC transporter ATP-binding protein, partial [Paludibacteraceae bacterium]|nr:ABC transporter ATP-binding protein [Paludibacteraceae bacterium]